MSHGFRSTLGRIAAAAALCLFATAAGAQYSTPVRDVENPARTPFIIDDTHILTSQYVATTFSITGSYPTGRMVIEHVSVTCKNPGEKGAVAIAQLQVRTGATTPYAGFDIPMQYRGLTAGSVSGRQHTTGSMTTRLYHGPSQGLLGYIARAADSGDVDIECRFTISGHSIAV